MADYKDFRLSIVRRGDEVWVTSSSPASGESEARLRLPDDLDAYQLTALLAAEHGGTARGTGDAEPRVERRIAINAGSSPSEERAERIGSELFETLFPGPIRDAFNRNWGTGRDSGVRIRLQINLNDDDETIQRLAGLPWELLYLDGTRTALGRSPLTPVVRYLNVPRPYTTVPLGGTLRVLLVVANPRDTHALDLTTEKEGIERVLRSLANVEVDVLEHATRDSLRDALDTKPYHVLHYMGHGGFEGGTGVLFLEDDERRAVPLSGELLGGTLSAMPSLRLVFLNACDTGRTNHEAGRDPFGGVAASLVLAGVPAVVAMQVPVSDRAALAFADKFYEQVAHRKPVDAAVSLGRQAIYWEDQTSLEWATPVLFMRAPDGHLFDVEPEPAEPEPVDAAPVPVPAAPPVARPRRGLVWGGAFLGVALLAALAFFLTRNGEPDDVLPDDPPIVEVPAPTPADVADVGLQPPQASLAVGGSLAFRSSLLDAERRPVTLLGDDGQPLRNRALTWSSSDSTVLRVSETGVVSAVGPGRATVYGQIGEHRDSARVSVRAP
ncbi:MAG: CHAT domain-containing protein [Rhodothermales bacterium]